MTGKLTYVVSDVRRCISENTIDELSDDLAMDYGVSLGEKDMIGESRGSQTAVTP